MRRRLFWLGLVALTGCASAPAPVIRTVDYPGIVHEDVSLTPDDAATADTFAKQWNGLEIPWSRYCHMWQGYQKRFGAEALPQRRASPALLHYFDLQVQGTCARAGSDEAQAVERRKEKDADAQKQAEVRQAQLHVVAGDEVRAGRCTDARASAFQGTAVRLKPLLEQAGPNGEVVTVLASQIVVATPSGAPFTFTSPLLRGETHVLAVSSVSVRLDMRDANNYPITTPSLFTEVAAMSGGVTDGRVLLANAGSAIAGRVIGEGCTLLLLVRKL